MKETYLLKGSFVTDGLASGHVLIVVGVGEMCVGSLVIEFIVGVGESVFAPVTVKHFGLVGVLMHLN